MKSTKTFNEMCNYTHELLTSLGYEYKLYNHLMAYYLNDEEIFNIYTGNTKEIWYRLYFGSTWYKAKLDIDGNYSSYEIDEITRYANKFVLDVKNRKILLRKREIEKDFDND